MQNQHNYVKMLSLEFVLSIGLGLFLLSTIQVSAQPLTKDTLTGNVTEVDISIDPGEPLPPNGTVTIGTEGATDTDMNAFPPEGVYVIISSDTVTVTNQTVDIGTAEEVETEPEGESQEETEPEGESQEETEPEGESQEEEEVEE
ncbi:MAG: hypothetical protein GEU26_02595 [Nitrososphaeraceae archaeon]|nr:hypothetical protein [Nitrososphaeraceae archaeon]